MAFEDEEIFNVIIGGALAWNVGCVALLLPLSSIVVGERIVTNGLLDTEFDVGFWVVSQVGAKLFGASVLVLECGESVAVDEVGRRKATMTV